ncbi:MAG: efflux transporter periplasmic adaptor subunit, partial [Odoribacter sp.]|nr:efflux transporter periplasmic adaptor subunit [Odoribacter sp.]
QAEVSEKYYSSLNGIASANFKTPYDTHVYTLKELNGKLLSVGQSIEENTFFLPVTFEFDNQGTVIPGSFVEIYLLSSPLENVLSLPVSALTNEMGTFYVYKQLDEEGYQKQEVKTGRNNGNEVEIISGVQPGDRIVTKGAYQVKMASASGAIPGHTHEH